jgi:hypothetical protein
VRTKHLSLVTQEHLDTPSEKPNASSPYGPVRAGLTTLPITQSQQLSELLSSLESVVENLNYKSFTVYDTLIIATENLRVALSNIATDVDGTE